MSKSRSPFISSDWIRDEDYCKLVYIDQLFSYSHSIDLKIIQFSLKWTILEKYGSNGNNKAVYVDLYSLNILCNLMN